MRIAVDAMGGDHAPSVIVDGAVAAARHLDAEIVLVGPTPELERALAAHADWSKLGITIADAPDVIGMSEAPAAALRRKPRASIRVAAELVARQGCGGAGEHGTYGRDGHGRARRVRDGERRRSSGARRDDSHAGATGGAARCRGQRRVPAAASAAVRRDGKCRGTGGVWRRAAARRAALDWRRRDQGQRIDA